MQHASRIARKAVVVGLLVGLFVPTFAQAQGTPAEQWVTWAGELDSDEFLVRETATLGLIAAGKGAIEPLKQVLAGESREATTRAVYVLQQLGSAEDLETQDAARTVLEETAGSQRNSVGRRAAAAILVLNEQREEQAVEQLTRLGANIGRTTMINGFGGVEEVASSIEIGPDWKGTERDLVRLKWIESIRQVVLVGEKVNDRVLACALAMPSLQALHAYRVQISDAGLAALGPQTELREVGLYYTSIGDAGLKSLASLPNLGRLKLYGNKITKAAKEEVEKNSPGINIDFRVGGYMGVACDTFDTSCIISSVQGGSPAEKAGLRGDDIIVTLDEQPVAGSSTLVELVSQRNAGETIRLVVQRRTITDENELKLEELKINVTLGEWDVKLSIQNNRP